MKKLLFILALSIVSMAAQAQSIRYLTPDFFTSVKMDTTIMYGQNFSILQKLNARSTRTLRDTLLMDVYSPPTTDTETKRPLMIFLHTGNFLPPGTAGPNGSRRDSVPTEICTRMAKMGYVAASLDYRVGWAPTTISEEMKRYTLISAAYRGFQDLNTAVRYFKANAARWGVDTNKIMVWGQGSGSYISYAASNARDSLKFENTLFGPRKFFFGQNRMIQPWVNGNIDGTSFNIAPANYWDTILKPIDTMCVPNHAANTSNFHFSVNMSGAMGDLTWVDQNSIPTISIQYPNDQFAPYADGTVLVNTARGFEPVIRAQGTDSIHRKLERLGINAKMHRLKAQYNPYKSIFDGRTGANLPGVYPIVGDTLTDSWPYEWWNPAHPRSAIGLQNNPRMSRLKAIKYIDSIMTFVAPRACVVLGLPCAGPVTATEDILSEQNTRLSIVPNPAYDLVHLQSDADNPIQAVQLFDISGRMVQQYTKVNSHLFQIPRNGLPSGMYVAKVKFEKGILAKKVVFSDY